MSDSISRKRKSPEVSNISPNSKKRRIDEASNQHGVGDPRKDRPNTRPKEIEIIDVDAIPDDEEAIRPKLLTQPTKLPSTRSQASNNLRSKSNSPARKILSSKTVPQAKMRTKQTVPRTSQKGNDSTSKKLTQKEAKAIEKERERREDQMTYEDYINALPGKWPEREAQYPQFLKGAVIFLAQHMKEKRRHIKKQLDRVSGGLKEN